MAARGIPTRPQRRTYEQLLERVRAKMDMLIDLHKHEGWWYPDDRTFSLYERNIEDMLTMLETGLGPEALSIKTVGGTVGEELAHARENYEDSFSHTTAANRFVALETARENLHAVAHALWEVTHNG